MNSAVKTRLQTLLDRAPLRQLRSAIALLERWITPGFDLAIRLYVASVFLRSGWLKISDWGTTRLLFANEYHVPLLPPDVAAVMGAGGEASSLGKCRMQNAKCKMEILDRENKLIRLDQA